MTAPERPMTPAEQIEALKAIRRDMASTLRKHRDITKAVLVEVIVAVSRHGGRGGDIIETLASRISDEKSEPRATMPGESLALLDDVVRDAAPRVGLDSRTLARLRGD